MLLKKADCAYLTVFSQNVMTEQKSRQEMGARERERHA